MRIRTVIVAVCGLMVVSVTDAHSQPFRAQLEPTVRAVRGQYPALVTADQIGEILNAIAWQHRPNVKLLKKGGGGNCPSPQGIDISCDILIWAPPGTAAEQTVHVDVLSGASSETLAPASPFWKSAGPCTKRPATHPQGGSGCEMKNALEPIAPGGETEPDIPPIVVVPPVQPPVTSAGLEVLTKLVEELRALVTTQQRELLSVLASQSQSLTDLKNASAALDARAAALEKKKLPCIVGSSRVLGSMRFCPEE